jgi:hypothetical protein
VRPALALALAALLACTQKRQESHAAVPLPAADAGTTAIDAAPASAATTASAAPAAKPSLSGQGADISWLVGTWERQSAPKEWLLFNAPKEVGVIGGNPPALTNRGEFIPNGRFVSLFFRGVGGSTVERVLEASADYAELRERSTPPATYRRGAPP